MNCGEVCSCLCLLPELLLLVLCGEAYSCLCLLSELLLLMFCGEANSCLCLLSELLLFVLGVDADGYRAVIDQRDLHIRAELSRADGFADGG